LKTISDRLNATPRKCLGWKTPTEVFREKTMEEMGRDPYPQRQQELQFGYRSQCASAVKADVPGFSQKNLADSVREGAAKAPGL